MPENKSYHLVIQTAFIGDVFLSIPFLNRLKKIYPDDPIIFIAKAGVAESLLKMKLIDELIEIKKSDRKSYSNAMLTLTEKKIVNLFCLHKSIRSSLFSFQVKADKKWVFHTTLNYFLFKNCITYQKKWPDAVRQLYLLKNVDSELNDLIHQKDWSYLNQYNSSSLNFPVIPEWMQFQNSKLGIDKQFLNLFNNNFKTVALFPGSVWPTKRWPTEKYFQLCIWLLENNINIVLLGGPDEKLISEKILNLINQKFKNNNLNIKNYTGEFNLYKSLQLIQTCDLVVGNDSSSSHLAASQNKPVVAIFGPTTLNLGFRPWQNQSKVIENNLLDCRPCGLHGHKKCPLEHHKCMNDITVDQVIIGIKDILYNLKRI